MAQFQLKRSHAIMFAIVALLAAFVALGPFVIVNEGTQVVVTRFGSIVCSHRDAGLYFKMPFVDVINVFPKKILSLDGDAQRIPTSENQFIIVDTTSRWRISDPAKFYRSFKSLGDAYVRLSDIVDSAVRTVVTQNTFSEVVRSTNNLSESGANEISVEGVEGIDLAEVQQDGTDDSANFPPIAKGRNVLSNEMADSVRVLIGEYGIELLDVVPRQIKYSDEMTASVYERMIKERNQQAQKYRAAGEGKKAEWLGKLENDKRTIMSDGYRKAEEIKGSADAEATQIYADAYSRDPEFFNFWRSIESYKNTLPKFNATVSTDMDYFKYLYSADGSD